MQNFFQRAVSSAAIAAFCLSPAAWAVDFAGETVEWTVPFKEGGGTSKLARFYAPLLAEALPGKPHVVVKNVPGGGSTTGANQFAQRAKPDGLSLLITSGSTQFPYLLGDSRVRYDYADWRVVLGSPTGGVVYVSPDLGVSSIEEIPLLKGKDLKYGSQGATSLDIIPLLAFELLGIDAKAVFGMKGRGEGRLAFERGETKIDYQTSSAYLKNVAPLVEQGKATPLFSFGGLDRDGGLIRDPTFPDLPHFGEAYEAVHGAPPSGELFDAWKTFFAAGFPAQKMIFLPKGTPREIALAYDEAFAKIVSAPGFAAQSRSRLGAYPQATGAAAAELKKIATSVDGESRRLIRGWLSDKYGVKF